LIADNFAAMLPRVEDVRFGEGTVAEERAKDSADTTKALTIEDILREEAVAIHGDRANAVAGKSGQDLYRALNGLESAALCLSGGGIRSAAFALGVVQALATHPRPVKNGQVQKDQHVVSENDSLLARFHYLSTVSGGGYIGSWLSTWLARRNLAEQPEWKPVWKALIGKRSDPRQEPPELSWLRRYSNFLTPKLGVTSADSWAAFSLVLRNIVLNWLIILPMLCALLLLCDLIALVFPWLATFDPSGGANRLAFFALVGAGCCAQVYALAFAARHRPTSRGPNNADQQSFVYNVLLPICIAGLLFAFATALPYAQSMAKNFVSSADWHPFTFYSAMTVAGAVVYAVSWLLAWPTRQYATDTVGDFFGWIVGGAVYGAMIGLGIHLFNYYIWGVGLWLFKPSELLILIAGLPWFLLSHLVAEIIYVGLTGGLPDSDTDREWLGRAAGWVLVIAVVWFVLMFLVFLGGKLTAEIFDKYWPWLTGGGVSAGGLVAWLAKSSVSPAKGEAKGKKQISANVLLAIAAPVFAVILIVLTSAILDRLLFDKALAESSVFNMKVREDGQMEWPGGWWVPGALVAALLIGIVASYYVNINRFSLHALYRNRLIRAFLGASNTKRTPNLFTGFDESDNLRAYDLWPKEVKPNQWPTITAPTWRPFHIINIALNSVSTSNLAWQERKAEPFTVSALHSGSSCVGYRYSTTYGDVRGISVGTALAISGAAASPNMGYHSSPALAFLMTLFNVRLGWWLGNPGSPGEGTYNLKGPEGAIIPLVYEMFGLTTDKWKYVYLSDGGHFENLGLYEMVRRRCRFIVISDAGCDPNYGFEDLGNAVRKISIDLGVPINIFKLETLKQRPAKDFIGLGAPYHAFGEIDYAAADDSGEKGYILYVKPGYHGVEGAGIRSYAIANADFPHESTGDQFFSESQFESYRSLGFSIVDELLNEALAVKTPPDTSLDGLFKVIKTL
jgi:hypothetical protein